MHLKQVQHLKTHAIQRQKIVQSQKTTLQYLLKLGHHVFTESCLLLLLHHLLFT